MPRKQEGPTKVTITNPGEHRKCLEVGRALSPVQCWGDGCEAKIPDNTDAVMNAHGWGFMYARDDFAPGGMGFYFACPDHKQKS